MNNRRTQNTTTTNMTRILPELVAGLLVSVGVSVCLYCNGSYRGPRVVVTISEITSLPVEKTILMGALEIQSGLAAVAIVVGDGVVVVVVVEMVRFRIDSYKIRLVV